MENVALFEWAVGAVFVGVNAYRRYNTPTSNRATTTFHNFVTFFLFYLVTVLAIYIILGAVFDSSPDAVAALYGMMVGAPGVSLPDGLSQLSAPMLSALFLTTLLPSLPLLSKYDQALLCKFWEKGHIPNHVNKMAASMRRAPFNFSPAQFKFLQKICRALSIDYKQLNLQHTNSLDYQWARLNVLMESLAEWKEDDTSRLREYMKQNADELKRFASSVEYINGEYKDLKAHQLEEEILSKIGTLLEKTITETFKEVTIFVAKATCIAELSESGRVSRVAQLGFEGGSRGSDRLSPRQISCALMGIMFTFLSVSVIQEFLKEPEYRKFGNVLFMTFLMLFTYGTALLIALDLKCRVGMGYNELTRQRSWMAYVWVGLITAFSWFLVTFSYRYILNMLSGVDSYENLMQTFTAVSWSYPYALQSLALAVSISWVLDHHQSQGVTGDLTVRQRFFDTGITVFALAVVSVISYMWMNGEGVFDGYGTKDAAYRGGMSMEWMVAKGVAVAAVVGWLVPMWFNKNRLNAPDQIAGRLIVMNKNGLSKEIRSLQPNELISVVAAVSAKMAAIDGVTRSEKDVYQIICSHLAGLSSSDVDVDAAEEAFDHCLELIKSDTLELNKKLSLLAGLPLLSALIPFIASSIAFADGVYLKQEKAMVADIQRKVHSEASVFS